MARLAGWDIDTPWPGCRYIMFRMQIHHGQDIDTSWPGCRYTMAKIQIHKYAKTQIQQSWIQLRYTTAGTQIPHHHDTQTEIYTDTTEQIQPFPFPLQPKETVQDQVYISLPLCYHRHIHNIWCVAPFLPLQDHFEIRGGLGMKCKFDITLHCVISSTMQITEKRYFCLNSFVVLLIIQSLWSGWIILDGGQSPGWKKRVVRSIGDLCRHLETDLFDIFAFLRFMSLSSNLYSSL